MQPNLSYNNKFLIKNSEKMLKTATQILRCRTKKITDLISFISVTSIFLILLSGHSFAEEKNNGFFSSLFKPHPRKHISIVGSSTVYPFTAVIAEKYGRRYKKYHTPTVEATGTGGGFKLFCSGIGHNFPDFVNASRPIKKSEIRNCRKNGIDQIKEIKIGYDGIVIANSKEAKPISLTKYQLFLALAEKVPHKGKLVKNFYKKWSDISPRLPDYEIRVYGPPPSSGTRDAFVELAMEKVCANNWTFKKAIPNKKVRKKKCHLIRSDGHFIEAGENDNLILQKLNNDAQAFGIFGFSFLNENESKIQAAKVNYVYPTIYNIKSNRYKISRPLFIYFKPQHIGLVKGTKEFVEAILSPDAIGEDGYLLRKGLIPLSDFELRRMRSKILGDL